MSLILLYQFSCLGKRCRMISWLVGFNVGLERRIGLLPTVWDASRKIIRRHAIAILIRHGGDVSPALVPTEVYGWELGGHCIHDGFYMHQVTLAYMTVFRLASLEPGLSSPELSAHSTCPSGGLLYGSVMHGICFNRNLIILKLLERLQQQGCTLQFLYLKFLSMLSYRK